MPFAQALMTSVRMILAIRSSLVGHEHSHKDAVCVDVLIKWAILDRKIIGNVA